MPNFKPLCYLVWPTDSLEINIRYAAKKKSLEKLEIAISRSNFKISLKNVSNGYPKDPLCLKISPPRPKTVAYR